MFRFAHPEYLYLLTLVPVFIMFFIYSLIIKNKRLKRFGNKVILKQFMPDVSHWRPRIKFYILLSAMALTIFIVAGPQFGNKLEKEKRQGIELMVAMDVSNSMMAEDIVPNRLAKSKQILSKLIDELENDKVGLIVFAGDSYIQMPITTDVISAKMFLSSINTGIVPVQGTSIGSAIKLAMNSFSPVEGVKRAIIVITDGENHEEDAVQVAQEAKEAGFIVHVLGVGSPEGAPIPVQGSNSFKRDAAGNVVISKLSEAMCQEISNAGGGIYVRADNTNAALRILTKELDKMTKSKIDSKVYKNYNEQFQPIAWLVLFLLLLDFCMLERKNPLLRKIKLF